MRDFRGLRLWFKADFAPLSPDAARGLRRSDFVAWLRYQWDQATPVWAWACVGAFGGALLLWLAGVLIPAFDPTVAIQVLAWAGALVCIINMIVFIYDTVNGAL